MKEFKGTPGPWVADIRGGCAAVYPESREGDTPGCHSDDDRNITFSSKGAKYNGLRWGMDNSVEHDFKLIAAAPELLELLLRLKSEVGGFLAHQHPELLSEVDEVTNKALGE